MDASAGECPRCGAAHEPMQEYCIECGLRLPRGRGFAPAVGRAWRLETSRHPGGWLWVVLCLLALAALATAAAIVASDEGSTAVRTIVATEPKPTTAPRTTSVPTTPTTTRPTSRTTTAQQPSRPVAWPTGRSGHTVVLGSVPATKGRDAALKLWQRAARAGLQDVGILDSSRFASLRPGYYVVFSGFYKTEAAATTAVEAAQTKGYPRAYEREITP